MNSGTASTEIISLPKGGGAAKGLGETFSPDLFTGTGNFTIPLALPSGRNGLQPQISLVYSTGNGNGAFGLGWSLSIPGVSRKTSKGIPRYRDNPSNPTFKPDVFILSGAEDLVPVSGSPTGARRYRPRTEGLFALIDHFRDESNNYWKVQSKDGLVSYYGNSSTLEAEPAIIAHPSDNPNASSKIFEWKLSRTEDPFGNHIEYKYIRDRGDGNTSTWDQIYLKQIRYVDYADASGQTQYLVTIEFLYDNELGPSGEGVAVKRPDSFSEYRSGFEIRTRRRCKWIVVKTHPTPTQEQLVRAYEFTYLDERNDLPNLQEILPLNRLSLLSQVQVIGYDDRNQPSQELPPLEFSYSRFEPNKRTFSAVRGKSLPPVSLGNPDFEMVDLFGNGLPDIFEINDTVRYWRNLGGGQFDMPRSMVEAPAGLRLADSGVQLIDANGDGRTDLLVTTADLSGYYSLTFQGGWDRQKSFQRYRYAPSFNLEDPEVRLVDLDGDGVTDAIRASTRLECYFNDANQGWKAQGDRVRYIERRSDGFPANFSDPRVKWADMTGDGLQDVVLIHNRRVDYWSNLGYGEFGARVTMSNSPSLPLDFDPRRLFVGDVDGDGYADMIYIENGQLTLWINQSGNGWSTPILIRGTPSVTDLDSLRLVDLNGTGVSGVLWTRDARGDGSDRYFFLDFTGGVKPYLLTEMNNHLGAVTKVEYVTSTVEYLRDWENELTRWRTPLPFPVQVVSKVEVIDEISQGKLTTVYRYHHGYWDGAEREFRGFGMVEQLDTESFAKYIAAGLHADTSFAAVDRQYFSAPTLTKTWFHQGAIGEEFGDWQEQDYTNEYWQGDPQILKHTKDVNTFLQSLPQRRMKRDALRVMRGSKLRSELYALDDSPLENRPYTVTENAYGLREEEPPIDITSTRNRIFFPFSTAQRTTQWERGSDPMTQFSYTSDYDAVGQPRRQIAIACPRGWRTLATSMTGFLGTLSYTEYVQTGGAYIRDRVARSRSFEIPVTTNQTVTQMVAIAETAESLQLISESLNFYDGSDNAATGFDAFVGLPFGAIGRFGALVRTETLVMTSTHLDSAYGTVKPPYLLPSVPFAASADYPNEFVTGLLVLGGYVYQPTSANYSGGYYTVAMSKRYDFHTATGRGRGLTLSQQDPLKHETVIDYDIYQLLPTKVTSPTGLTTQAEHNYRLFQAKRVTDPNGNVTEVAYSPMGLLTDTWVRGKSGRNQGDEIAASVHMEYGLRAFYNSKRITPNDPQPVFVRAIRRVHHDTERDLTMLQRDETIEAREYSDGFGRLLQTRTQGESVRFGDAHFGGGNDVLHPNQTETLSPIAGNENNDPNSPNVVVSGWQRYDNKGRVVEKYEPFYDIGWAYQPVQESKQGQYVRMYYDPRGQAIRTVNPDGSEQRVIYGIPLNLDAPPLSLLETDKFTPTPWEAYTYDPNDNAGRTHANPEPHTNYPHHYNTPSSIEIDPLGRTIRAIARHREAPLSDGTLPPIAKHVTRSQYDIQGNLRTIHDALGRLAFEYVYDLAKRPLRTESIDAGRKVVVIDAAGNPLESRDAKGAMSLHAYDALNRPTRLWARDGAGEAMTLREKLIYDRDPVTLRDPVDPRDPTDPARGADHNLLGKLVQHFDEAGVVTIEDYDFKGNILSSSRQVLSDEFMLSNFRAQTGSEWVLRSPRVDWASPPANLLDSRQYRSRSAFDALNRVKWSDYPQAANNERYRLQPDYNRAGALERVDLIGPLDANDQGSLQPYVERIAYNAKGQRSLIVYGNGLMTRYAYDDRTFRLLRLRTDRLDGASRSNPLVYNSTGAPLQDIAYWYDLSGNILGMQDFTPGCGVANNADAPYYEGNLRSQLSAGDALIRCFEYDPLYRLTSATGRESKRNIPSSLPPWSNELPSGYNSGSHGTPNQDNAPALTALYWEEYSYDAAGNMLTLRHNQSVQRNGAVGWETTWSRRFGMDGLSPSQWQTESANHLTGDWTNPLSNRLTHVENRRIGVSSPPIVAQSHFYDANGNMVRENEARHFEWDYADRMKVFRTQTDRSKPTTYAIYLYDAGGMRVKKLVVTGNRYRTTTYLGEAFEHHAEFAQLDGSGKQENFSLHVMDDKSRIAIKRVGEAFDDDGAKEHRVQYHLGDHLGSSALVISGEGDWINREEFFPYGETSFGSFGRKRYRFTGKERDDESGLNYHEKRYYSANLAVWISCDPKGAIDGSNLYSYCRRSPMFFLDQHGTETGDVSRSHTFEPEIITGTLTSSQSNIPEITANPLGDASTQDLPKQYEGNLSLWNEIKGAASSAWNGIKGAASSAWNGLAGDDGFFEDAFEVIGHLTWGSLGTAVGALVTAVNLTIGNLVTAVHNAFSSNKWEYASLSIGGPNGEDDIIGNYGGLFNMGELKAAVTLGPFVFFQGSGADAKGKKGNGASGVQDYYAKQSPIYNIYGNKQPLRIADHEEGHEDQNLLYGPLTLPLGLIFSLLPNALGEDTEYSGWFWFDRQANRWSGKNSPFTPNNSVHP